jgi:dimethylhistidine N-methyltransferase
VPAAARYSYHDLKPGRASLLEDVIAGLSAPQKALPAKYFYDEVGAELFERICELPEYYPTRTELAMLSARSEEIADAIGRDSTIIEYGSGSGRKTRVLIAAVKPRAYVAIDIACEQLQSAVGELASTFPGVHMVAVCADYSGAYTLPSLDVPAHSRRVVFFPGSTIGNFTRAEALAFLRKAREVATGSGAMLIGVDLKKSTRVLNAAYNDASGVTAAFNKNLLHRINRELGADFDAASFRHDAYYDEAAGRVEMHLVSTCPQRVSIAGRTFIFAEGESIHTENSHKYSVDEFQALAREAGFHPLKYWTDSAHLFSIHCLAASPHVSDSRLEASASIDIG